MLQLIITILSAVIGLIYLIYYLLRRHEYHTLNTPITVHLVNVERYINTRNKFRIRYEFIYNLPDKSQIKFHRRSSIKRSYITDIRDGAEFFRPDYTIYVNHNPETGHYFTHSFITEEEHFSLVRRMNSSLTIFVICLVILSANLLIYIL